MARHQSRRAYLDATLGLGGHAEAILNKLSERAACEAWIWTRKPPEAGAAARHGMRARAVRANFRSVRATLEAERFFP